MCEKSDEVEGQYAGETEDEEKEGRARRVSLIRSLLSWIGICGVFKLCKVDELQKGFFRVLRVRPFHERNGGQASLFSQPSVLQLRMIINSIFPSWG